LQAYIVKISLTGIGTQNSFYGGSKIIDQWMDFTAFGYGFSFVGDVYNVKLYFFKGMIGIDG